MREGMVKSLPYFFWEYFTLDGQGSIEGPNPAAPDHQIMYARNTASIRTQKDSKFSISLAYN